MWMGLFGLVIICNLQLKCIYVCHRPFISTNDLRVCLFWKIWFFHGCSNLLILEIYCLFHKICFLRGFQNPMGWWIMVYSQNGYKTKSWNQNPLRDYHVRDSRVRLKKCKRWEDSGFSYFLFPKSDLPISVFFFGVTDQSISQQVFSKFWWFASQPREVCLTVIIIRFFPLLPSRSYFPFYSLLYCQF